MATVDLQRPSGRPSPLQVDLALAKVGLAALRARRGQEVDEQSRAAAGLLKEHYSRRIQAAKNPVSVISADLVPDEQTRQALQKGLASMARAEAQLGQEDEERLGHLIELLSTLADAGRCEPDDAKEIHSLLHTLEARRPAPLPVPEFAH